MTAPLSGKEIADRVGQRFPGAVELCDGHCLWVKRQYLVEVARFLRENLELDYLNNLTAVDYWDYFEVVYHLTSLKHNHSLVMKAQCPRQDPQVPSLVGVWKGADLQEREVYDLMGVSFQGHPNMKRILLWEGFQGHPLRKDYL